MEKESLMPHAFSWHQKHFLQRCQIHKIGLSPITPSPFSYWLIRPPLALSFSTSILDFWSPPRVVTANSGTSSSSVLPVEMRKKLQQNASLNVNSSCNCYLCGGISFVIVLGVF
jgi:hypothetical protein